MQMCDILTYSFIQLSMPCMFLAYARQILLFLPTLKYALHIYGRYAIYLIIFPKLLSMPWIIPSDTRQNYFFTSTIKYAPYIPCINLTDLLLSTIKYALYIPERYETDLLVSPTIKYALYIHGRYVTD